METRDAYNLIAEDWHKDHQSDDWWVEGTDKFISFLHPGSAVLDVGCGGGTKAGYLVDRGLEVTGIDFSEKLIAICRREVPEARFLTMDMRNLGALSQLQVFDGIFIQAALLHIPKREVGRTLAGLIERLKNGGLLYLAVKEKRSEGVEEEIRREADYGHPYERFFSYFTMEELEKYLSDFDFKVVWRSAAPSGKTVWLQIIGQKNN